MSQYLSIKTKKNSLIYFTGIIILFVIYQYHGVLFRKPGLHHQWRQCDCLSLTLNYCKENRPFLDPSVHWIGEGGSETISEFPILYYTVAQVWKIFGADEFTYRLLQTIILFISLFLLAKIFEQYLNNPYWAIGSVMLLFTSPAWIFYGNSFLADVPALSCAIIGWFYFLRFYSREKNRDLFIAMFFFLLGGLLKISSLISFASITGIFILESVFSLKLGPGRKLFNTKKTQFMPFVIIIAITFVWYEYAAWFNKHHEGTVFLLGILPIWHLSYEEVIAVLDELKTEVLYYFYNSMFCFYSF